MGDWKLDVDGVTKDFDTDYGFKVKSYPGTGHSPVINRSTDYALQDGALFTGQKMGIRTFTLIGAFYGSATLAAFHDQRQALIKALSSRTTKINKKPATIKLTYTGGTVDKEIDCIYEGGLELASFVPFIENDVPIRFTAFNPQWNATSDTTAPLETSGTFSPLRIAGLVDNVWGGVGSGLNSTGYAVAYDSANNILYVGGAFTTAGGVSASRVAKYDVSTNTWSALGSGLNGICYAMALAANGDLYVGGAFTSAGGVSNTARVAKWNGLSWSALGSGLDDGQCAALAYDRTNGYLYAGGTFTSASSVANTQYIAYFNGTAWVTMGDANDEVRALVLTDDEVLYAGGDFTTIGGSAINRVARWNDPSWDDLSSPFTGGGNSCTCLAFDNTNEYLYAGGTVVQRIRRYEVGVGWATITSTGLNSNPEGLSYDATNSILYVGGAFTTVDGVSLPKLATWDGSAWASGGIAPNNTVYSIVSSENVYITGAFTAADTTAGYATIEYAGSEIAYPVFTVRRDGGTSAALDFLANLETGAFIYFDYSLADGETLTIDFRPGQRSCISSISGSVWNAIDDNSDVANFYLQPGNGSSTNDNVIVIESTLVGSPTITASMIYRTAYRSLD